MRSAGRLVVQRCPGAAARCELYLQFGAEPRFDPFAMTAPAALALLQAMATPLWARRTGSARCTAPCHG